MQLDYDAAGRLARVSVDGAQLRRYEYDQGQPGNGNRTREYGPGDVLLASAGYDAQDRMASYGATSYAYTAAGELTRRASPAETLATVYDALGNLVSAGLKAATTSGPEAGVTVGTLLTYQVDGQNRRVRKLVNDGPVRGWLYRDGIAVGAELDAAGALLNRYVYATHGHVPDLLLRGDTAYRVVTDQLGSVRAMVRASDGAVVQRRDYDAWGVVTHEVAPEFQSLGYAGGLEDSDTKLVRFGARDYEPATGRWTAKDPIWGSTADVSSYGYVADSPIDLTDATGLVPDALSRLRAHWRCAHAKAREFYGVWLDLSDATSYLSIPATLIALPQTGITAGLHEAAFDAIWNSRLKGAQAGLAWGARARLAREGAREAARLTALKGAMTWLGNATGLASAFSTGFSLGAVIAFWGDCNCTKRAGGR